MTEHYHFIGIGGIGMSGLAHMLLQKNISVTGSDLATSYVTEGLVKAGATVHLGHSPSHVKPGMIVVYTSDIKLDNPEYLAAQKLGCTLWHRSDLLARLMRDQTPLVVAGTHGKTTTSALLSAVLIEAGLDPSIVVGGVIPQYHCNSRLGYGKYFVFEADESDGTFLKYHPFGAIVTNIDNDHLINYQGSEEVLTQAFNQFMSHVNSTKHLFWCGDDPKLVQLDRPGQTYGFSPQCDWRLSNLQQEGFTSTFDLTHKTRQYKQIESALIGTHNALNCAAVFGLAVALGVNESAIRAAFKGFKGVLRRCEMKALFTFPDRISIRREAPDIGDCDEGIAIAIAEEQSPTDGGLAADRKLTEKVNKAEIKGEENDILFIDDYAHHPTEVVTTLRGIRQAMVGRRLLAVFQPHRYSRTQDCLGSYGHIFDVVDRLIITDIFSAGEQPIPGLHAGLILDEVQQKSNVNSELVTRHKLAEHLQIICEPGDVVVTLGAGDITKLAGETFALLKAKNRVQTV